MSISYDEEKQALRAELEAIHSQVWDTDELQRDFKVEGFMWGLCIARRKSDGMIGTLDFVHMPRLYYGFRPDPKQ